MGLMIRPFAVTVSGFPAVTYYAASRGKALSKAWNDYLACNGEIKFGEFLTIVRARQIRPYGEFGKKIRVANQLAYYIGQWGQYIRIAFDGAMETSLSHPLDVRPY